MLRVMRCLMRSGYAHLQCLCRKDVLIKRLINSFRAVFCQSIRPCKSMAHRLQAVKALDVIEASFARVLQILHTPAMTVY